jgi:hypothetical protein
MSEPTVQTLEDLAPYLGEPSIPSTPPPTDAWQIGRGTITYTHGSTILEAADIAELGRKLHAYVTIVQSGKAVYWSDVDVTSASARLSIGKSLTIPAGRPPSFWKDVLDAFCHGVMLRWQENARATLLIGQEWEGESFVVAPMVPRNEPSIIYGDGKSGKGYLAMLISYATMYPGVKLPGGLVAPSSGGGGVLYLDWESGQKRIQHRLYRVGRALNLPSQNLPFAYQQMGGRSLESSIRSIRADIREKTIKLLVVDSLAPASMSVGTTDGAGGAIQFMNALNGLCQDYEIAALCIGHVTKTKKKEVFGSVFFKNLARSLWAVTKERDGLVLEVTASHQEVNDGQLEDDLKVTFTFEPSGLVSVVGAGPALSIAGTLKQTLAVLPAGSLVPLSTLLGRLPDADGKVVKKRLAHAVANKYLVETSGAWEASYTHGPKFTDWPSRAA